MIKRVFRECKDKTFGSRHQIVCVCVGSIAKGMVQHLLLIIFFVLVSSKSMVGVDELLSFGFTYSLCGSADFLFILLVMGYVINPKGNKETTQKKKPEDFSPAIRLFCCSIIQLCVFGWLCVMNDDYHYYTVCTIFFWSMPQSIAQQIQILLRLLLLYYSI